MLRRLTAPSLLFLTAIWTTSCATPPAPEANACTWDSLDVPGPGFETRWTEAEKRWALDHNLKIKKFCP